MRVCRCEAAMPHAAPVVVAGELIVMRVEDWRGTE